MKSLLVEDNPTDARLIREFLKEAPPGSLQVAHVGRLDAALARLRAETFDLVLLDFGLPDSQGMATLTRIQGAGGDWPIVALTGLDDQAFAVEVLRSGAQDYLVKGQFDGNLLVRTMHYAVERKRAEKEVRRLNAELRRANETLSESNLALESEMARRKVVLRKLHDAEETERGRISRELHDRLGQDLTALKLGLNWLQKQCPFVPRSATAAAAAHEGRAGKLPARPGYHPAAGEPKSEPMKERCPFAGGIQDGIIRLEHLADGLMQGIHRLAWELHPAVLDDLGLEAALRRYFAEWSEPGNVAVDFHCDGLASSRLPLELETALYRVTQEALTNVLRHAQAKRVSVLLERRAVHVSLIVEDDGVGFEAGAVLEAPGIRGKLGMLGMAERIRLAGGTLDIESAPARGTTVFVRVPLEDKTTERERKP